MCVRQRKVLKRETEKDAEIQGQSIRKTTSTHTMHEHKHESMHANFHLLPLAILGKEKCRILRKQAK